MTQMREWARNEVFPSYYVNEIDEHVSTLGSNLVLSKASATSVQVVAGTGDASVHLAIMGRWRRATSTKTRAHPGGAIGTYTVWAVASDNDVENTPQPNTDLTVYEFDLRITDGSTPTGTGTAIYLKIGEVDWNSAAITAVRQTKGLVTGAMIASGAIASSADIAATRQSDGSFTLSFVSDMATQAELDAAIASEAGLRAAGDANNPTAAQKAALAGSSGSPGAGNAYVTQSDPVLVAARTPLAHHASHQPGGSDTLDWTTVRMADVLANRPAASAALNGVTFFATDKMIEYLCVGGAWVITSVLAPEVTVLPSSPVDGQECMFLVTTVPSGEPPIRWRLKYRAASTSPYKWEFIGGPELAYIVDAPTTVTSSGYSSLTGGPSFLLPALSGDFDFHLSATVETDGNGFPAFMSFIVGGAPASDADALTAYFFRSADVSNADIVSGGTFSRTRRRTATAPSLQVIAQGRSPSGRASSFADRRIGVTPVRVG